jgi:hypothetical protein
MKTIAGKIFGLIFFTALLLGANSVAGVQATGQPHFRAGTNSPYAVLSHPGLTNLPGALPLLNYVLSTAAPARTLPVINATNGSVGGTYFSLQFSRQPPSPGNFFPALPVYALDTSNRIFLIDDRSVDFSALEVLAAAAAKTNVIQLTRSEIDTNQLWLDVPTNALTGSNLFKVVIRHTTAGKYYDVLTKTDLTLPHWTVEQYVTANSAATPVTLTQDERTNLFVWAREAVIPIFTQPLSQEVYSGDTVTFSVTAAGGNNLFYQWTYNGTNINGATGSSYTINNVNESQSGNYACVIHNAVGTETTQTATLTVYQGTGWPRFTAAFGQRQDYTFRSGVTYLITTPIELFGKTTIEAGAIIKFDYTGIYPCLQILGTLECQGEPYQPAVLTSVDDNTIGYPLGYHVPYPNATGVPYLDLTAAGDTSIGHLRFRYADMAVATPYQGRLDVWDSQFLQCYAGVITYFGGVNSFHNVLFSSCHDAVTAGNHPFAIEMEQVTADVTNLWNAAMAPDRLGLTNSIIIGNVGTTTNFSQVSTTLNPTGSDFQTNSKGNYYLAGGSGLRQSGTTNISPRLLGELRQKTTQPPLALPPLMDVSGQLTLLPQVPRYTGGLPDRGYYYDALDYTVAFLLNRGSIVVEPGTVIGFRNEYAAALNRFTWWGCVLTENSTFTSHGTAPRPVTFADIQTVQEQWALNCNVYFVPDFEADPSETAPVMDFRFCDFFGTPENFLVCGGNWEFYYGYGDNPASPDALVNWNMSDCRLHGGRISLGVPDDGTYYPGLLPDHYFGAGVVIWENNLFADVSISLDPTYYWLNGVVNCDLAFAARNNLFKGGSWFAIEPIPASAGAWTFTDNLFDKANLQTDTNAPLNFDHNGYWPVPPGEALLNTFSYTLLATAGDTRQLQATNNSLGGSHEVVLSYPPPYAKSVFGNYYLSTLTPLYQAGSRTTSAAGLTEYTTFANQFRAPTNSPVSIGLHYVAVTNNSSLITNPEPLDSDSDGVPNYVEAEHGTDLHNAMTDGVTNDTYNVAYDDVDLSGNGLVGRIKKALGLNPLERNNSLTLTQVITGEEPDIATFEVPVSYDAITNLGEIELALNGQAAQFQQCDRNTNGNCLLKWNTTFDPPGQYYPAAQFRLNGKLSIGTAYAPDPTILYGVGKITSYLSTNACQFNPFYSEFDRANGGILYAKIPASLDADYSVEIKTTNGIHIKTITGSTTNGEIVESWDSTDDNGNAYFRSSDFEATFNVTLPGQGAVANTSHSRWKDAGGVREGEFTVAYATDDTTLAQTAIKFCIQFSVVNPLISVSTVGQWNPDPYLSSFNAFGLQNFGNPAYLSGPADVANLLENLANPETRNFYFDGHGSESKIGNNLTNPPSGYVDIGVADIAVLLTNSLLSKVPKGLLREHPYRFVFLNACHTANDDQWHNAFGIYKRIWTADLTRNPGNAQAFVGWVNSPRMPLTADDWYDIQATYTLFFSEWMSNVPLDECLDAATKRQPFPIDYPYIILDWPLTKKFALPVFTDGNIFYPSSWHIVEKFHLKIYGYAGLKRRGFAPAHDNSKYYEE